MKETTVPLKSDGNLTYPDFIRLLCYLWERAHPEIPIVPHGASTMSRYPCVVYSLEVRTPYRDEPKPKQREVVRTSDDKASIIKGQRFTNLVKFTAVDEVEPDGAQVVEELIEVFEDFMLYHTGIFKRLGLAECTYNRRLPDEEQSRPAEGIVGRSLVYSLATEKLMVFEVDRLRSIYIEAVRFLEGNQATPSTVDDDGEVVVAIVDSEARDLL